MQQPAFRVNAVLCCFTVFAEIIPNYAGCQFDLRSVLVEFWSHDDVKLQPLLSFKV